MPRGPVESLNPEVHAVRTSHHPAEGQAPKALRPSPLRWRPVVTGLAVLALVAAASVIPAMPASAATTTVGNGLTTTDLSSVGMSPSVLASSLVGPGVSVSNVTYSGSNGQAGLIHVVDPAVVSFNDGVILSSGTSPTSSARTSPTASPATWPARPTPT